MRTRAAARRQRAAAEAGAGAHSAQRRPPRARTAAALPPAPQEDGTALLVVVEATLHAVRAPQGAQRRTTPAPVNVSALATAWIRDGASPPHRHSTLGAASAGGPVSHGSSAPGGVFAPPRASPEAACYVPDPASLAAAVLRAVQAHPAAAAHLAVRVRATTGDAALVRGDLVLTLPCPAPASDGGATAPAAAVAVPAARGRQTRTSPARHAAAQLARVPLALWPLVAVRVVRRGRPHLYVSTCGTPPLWRVAGALTRGGVPTDTPLSRCTLHTLAPPARSLQQTGADATLWTLLEALSAAVARPPAPAHTDSAVSLAPAPPAARCGTDASVPSVPSAVRAPPAEREDHTALLPTSRSRPDGSGSGAPTVKQRSSPQGVPHTDATSDTARRLKADAATLLGDTAPTTAQRAMVTHILGALKRAASDATAGTPLDAATSAASATVATPAPAAAPAPVAAVASAGKAAASGAGEAAAPGSAVHEAFHPSPLAAAAAPRTLAAQSAPQDQGWMACLPAVLAHARAMEAQRPPPSNCLTGHPDLNFRMRTILIDWLCEVSLRFKLRAESMFMTVHLVDSFLMALSEPLPRDRLQLVGVTAMLLASKFEEIYHPDVHQMVHITDDAYTRRQLLDMEATMLRVLGHRMRHPTACTFLGLYCGERESASREAALLRRTATFYCQCLLQEQEHTTLQPSLVAAAALHTARRQHKLPPWPPHLAATTGYTEAALGPTVVTLHTAITRPPGKSVSHRWRGLGGKKQPIPAPPAGMTLC